MASKLLFNNGNLVLRTGSVQVIPDGMNASDCTCCGGGGCDRCPEHPSGPFNRMKITATVSGWPNVFQFVFVKLISVQGQYVWLRAYGTITGLDWLNGTRSIEQDANCQLSELLLTNNVSVSFYYEQISQSDTWPYPDEQSAYCSLDPPLYFVVDSWTEFYPSIASGYYQFDYGVRFTIPTPYNTCRRTNALQDIGQVFAADTFTSGCLDTVINFPSYCEMLFPRIMPPYGPFCWDSCCFVDPSFTVSTQFTHSEA